jgi:collagen type VII alpha
MTKISSLPTLTTITDATIMPAVDGGVTQKLTGSLLKSYILDGFTGSAGTGTVGFTGSTGTQGITGFTGSTGTQGITGFTGSKGDPGTGGNGITSPFASIFTITNTTVSTSAITGALQVAGGVGIGGDLFVGGGIAGYAPLDSPIFEGTAQFSTATFTGTVTMQQSTEKFVTASPVAGAVALNFNQAAIFVVTPDNSNFIADFLNIPGTAGRTITTTLILTQGSTPYIPNAVKINGGSSITPKWLGGSEPTGTANCTEIVSFIFVCIATNTWTVLGSLSSYGTAG